MNEWMENWWDTMHLLLQEEFYGKSIIDADRELVEMV